MKKIVFAVFALLFTSFIANAQPGFGKGQGGRDAMFEKLNLTEKQTSQMKDINNDFRTSMTDLQDNQQLSENEIAESKREIFIVRNKRIMSILSAEQLKQYEEITGSRSSGHFDDVEFYREKLGLSQEQVDKFKELQGSMKEKEMNIMKNKDITDEQRAQFRQAMDKNNYEILKTILTVDQMSKLSQMMEKKKEGNPAMEKEFKLHN